MLRQYTPPKTNMSVMAYEKIVLGYKYFAFEMAPLKRGNTFRISFVFEGVHKALIHKLISQTDKRTLCLSCQIGWDRPCSDWLQPQGFLGTQRPARPLLFCRLCLGKLKLEFRILSLNSAFFVPKIGEVCGGMEVAMSFFYTPVVFGYPLVGTNISHIPTKREVRSPSSSTRDKLPLGGDYVRVRLQEEEIPGMIS